MRGAFLAPFLAAVWIPTPADSPDLTAANTGSKVPPPSMRVTNRPGNLGGKVLVLMYHRTAAKEVYMVRSRDNFKRDLARLYKLGYRPVTISEYTENRMALPPGASPVVLTFDDSHASQISFGKDGNVDPNTFVGMWLEFAKTRPDFPLKGTFYANNNGPFGDPKTGEKAIKFLQSHGSEIAAHTAHHVNLLKVSEAKGKDDIAKNVAYLEKRGAKIKAFATPYGVWPKSHRWLSEGFVWKGQKISFESVVAAGAGPGHSPVSKHMNSKMIPRVQAYNGFKGIHWWLDKEKEGHYSAYVQP